MEGAGTKKLNLWDLQRDTVNIEPVCKAMLPMFVKEKVAECKNVAGVEMETLSGLSRAQQKCQACAEAWAWVSHFWAAFLRSMSGSKYSW